MWLAGSLCQFHPDRFVLSLVGVVLAATLLPCRGVTASAVHVMGLCAIASLFFLQGARLSRDAVVGGITHWRLHTTIGSATFILFPLTGWCLVTLFPHLLPQTLWLGMIFLRAAVHRSVINRTDFDRTGKCGGRDLLGHCVERLRSRAHAAHPCRAVATARRRHCRAQRGAGGTRTPRPVCGWAPATALDRRLGRAKPQGTGDHGPRLHGSYVELDIRSMIWSRFLYGVAGRRRSIRW